MFTVTEGRNRGVTFGLPSHALGAAEYGHGSTRVHAAVRGPEGNRGMGSYDGVTVQVHLTRARGVCAAGAAGRIATTSQRKDQKNRDVQAALIVQGVLENVILSEAYPRSVVTVSLHILRDDGSVLSALLNGAMAALIESGIMCTTTLVAATVSFSATGKECQMFPTADEESCAAAVGTYVHDSTGLGLLYSDFTVCNSNNISGKAIDSSLYAIGEGVCRERVAASISFLREELTIAVGQSATEMSF